MLGYMALVIRMDTHDLNEVHATTYEKARQDIPAEEYRKLTEALPFRKKWQAIRYNLKRSFRFIQSNRSILDYAGYLIDWVFRWSPQQLYHQ